jgi:hypothetical protein
MRCLNADEVLDIWEAGCNASPSRRSLILLAAALPEQRGSLANATLGSVSAALLHLRAMLFGSTADCVANCPACEQLLETSFSVDDLLADHASHLVTVESTHHRMNYGECAVDFRLPTATDLVEVGDARTQDGSALALRVISRPMNGDNGATVQELPDGVVQAVERRIVELDPLAQIELKLDCPTCRNSWKVVLHVIDFLWLEIDNLARRLLFEVARLASQFSWSERQILALSPERRRRYLELIGP